MDIPQWMESFSDFVWSTPTAILLTGAGVLFTLATLGIQLKSLTHGFAVIRGKYDNPEDEGNISHFQALCAALSATIGLGNISGVAVAVSTGGPGAVFWMWVVGFVGMATKFTTCSLSTMFRKRDRFGEYRGGPMYYIEMGLGGKAGTPTRRGLAKGLAVLFAVLGMSASVGAGNMFQANQVAKIFVNLFQNTVTGGLSESAQFGVQMVVGALLCLLAALVMIGGIRRIGQVASTLVPSMCVIYVLGALYIILTHLEEVPAIIASIFSHAFTPAAGQGAFFGVAVRTAVIQGVRRACFSNEAGLGSAPIAHATAKTDEPIREGVVASVGPFVDTIVICTMTALVVMITGTVTRDPVGTVISSSPPEHVQVDAASEVNVVEMEVRVALSDTEVAKLGEELFVHKPPGGAGEEADQIHFRISAIEDTHVTARLSYPQGVEGMAQAATERAHLQAGSAVFLFRDGVNLTAYAFDRGLQGFGTYFIPIAAVMFAFSTIISWGFYGETCTEYLFGEQAVMPFKFVFVGMILVGTASMRLEPVLDWSDGMLGLMLVPNLIGTILLLPTVTRETRRYFQRLKAGEFDIDMQRAAEARARARGERD